DIGVEAYKIAASLRGVVAQRLMRKLCPTCKEVWMEAPAERLRRWIPKGTPLYRAGGCPDCAMTGYRGRFSILEILTMTAELERRIAAGEAADRIAEAARRGGMKSLWDSGLAHVTRGESTLDELTRVVDIPSDEAAPGGPEQRSAGATRKPGATDGLRFTTPPGAVAVPPFPEPGVAAPVSTHFDLLEEPAPPGETHRSGAHGHPASNVLLVDDEDSLPKVMRDLLERDGYDVTEARAGVLRGHVRVARRGGQSRGARPAPRSTRPQSGILGDSARHDRVRRDAGPGVAARAARGNGPGAGEILQSQPHRGVLSAPARRAGADSGVRRLRPARR